MTLMICKSSFEVLKLYKGNRESKGQRERVRQDEKEDLSQGNRTLFVGNVWLYNLLSKFGKIRDLFITSKKSKITGQSSCFIRFLTKVEGYIINTSEIPCGVVDIVRLLPTCTRGRYDSIVLLGDWNLEVKRRLVIRGLGVPGLSYALMCSIEFFVIII